MQYDINQFSMKILIHNITVLCPCFFELSSVTLI